MATLAGLVENVRSGQNGWATVKIKVPGPPAQVLYVRGFIGDMEKGQWVEIQAQERVRRGTKKTEWFVDTYGEILLDGRSAPEEASIKNLVDLIPGVGKETARKLVQIGIDRLLTDSDLLADSVAPRYRQEALLAWEQHQSEIRLRNILRLAGLGIARQRELFKACGGIHGAQLRLSRDPWSLANELPGIGFLTMDAVAREMDIPMDHPSRLLAGTTYAANELSNRNGDTIFPKTALIKKASEILRVNASPIEEILTTADEVLQDMENGWVGPVNLVAAEEAIAYTVEELLKYDGLHIPPQMLDKVAKSRGLDDMQRIALSELSENAISALTGRPGTGKTTVMGAFVEAATLSGFKIILICPTGSAARTLSNAAGYPASTIHRWLGQIERDEFPPAADLVIVDESSLLSSPLAGRLLRSMRAVTDRIIFCGDDNQLPPVESGRPFRDLLTAKTVLGDGESITIPAIPVVRLLKIWRQAGGSPIPFVAKAITENRDPRREEELGGEMHQPIYQEKNDAYIVSQTEGWRFIECDTPEAVEREALIEAKRHVEMFGLDDVAILSANYAGLAGVDALGSKLQEHYNPNPKQVVMGELDEAGLRPRWCIDDPVMFLGNDYRYDPPLTHAMRGRIIGLRFPKGEPRIALIEWEDGVIRQHDFTSEGTLARVVLAYSLTVHRSQGAEFNGVVLTLTENNLGTASRELVYTGLTRAKKSAVLVAERGTLTKAIAKLGTSRHTALSLLLERPWYRPVPN